MLVISKRVKKDEALLELNWYSENLLASLLLKLASVDFFSKTTIQLQLESKERAKKTQDLKR